MKQKGVTKNKRTKALKDRVHQHLNDKNDIITDEDIKNIKVGEDAVEEDPEFKEDIKDADELANAIKEKKAIHSVDYYGGRRQLKLTGKLIL